MKRAIPVLLLSISGLVPVWAYEPSVPDELSEVAADTTTPEQQTQGEPTSGVPSTTTPTTSQQETSQQQSQVTTTPPQPSNGPAPTKPQQPTLQPTPPAPTKTESNQARSVPGPVVATSHGNVQVQVTFQGGKITDVKALKAPNTAQTRTALPLLRQSALQAQSANIDTVSGATATSAGYRQSLQAAIDSAR